MGLINDNKDTKYSPENSFEVLKKTPSIAESKTPTFREQKDSSNRSSLPQEARGVLKTWLHEHIDHPYPTESEKNLLAQQVSPVFVSKFRHYGAIT